MENERKRQVVIFIGAPGSGKGTQALWLENEAGFFHLESTAVIRRKFADKPSDPLIIEQKAKVASGDIVDPPVILKWMQEAVTELANQGNSIVLSGSPRSKFEAAGDEQTQGLIPLLEQLYGSENIFILRLNITEQEAIRRSFGRRVCVANNHPIPNLPEYNDLKACPWDNSPLRKRSDGLDDDADIIRKRYREYNERMEQVFEYLHERGFTVVEISGGDSIEAIHHQVVNAIERHGLPIPKS